MPINLRSLFVPVQPTVKQSSNKVSYHEFLPNPDLQNYIYCYWQLSAPESQEQDFIYRVVSDGCIDIFFDLNTPQENFVMGFCKKHTEFQLENSFNYIGIRFLPTAFPRIFNVSASELSNRSQYLNAVVPETAAFIASNFHSALQMQQIHELLDTHFIQLLKDITIKPDARLYDAIAIILKNHGVVNVEKELDTGISLRQLRRLFGFYIGTTAKTFSKVVRFQNMLCPKPSTQRSLENKLFYGAGYYDQAHFIKEFKNLYGATPGKALER